MHYYPHHIGDFVKATARLTDAQCMAYLRLIWKYYDDEAPLSSSPESLAFSIGASLEDVRQILEHFFVFDGTAYRHNRCDEVLAEYRLKAGKAAQSAKARWDKEREKKQKQEQGEDANASEDHANALHPESERTAIERVFDANQKPITNNQKPINTPPTPKEEDRAASGDSEQYEETFIEFWKNWPTNKRKGSKPQCGAFWKRKKLHIKTKQIIEHVNLMKNSHDWTKDNGQYMPAPLTYLHQMRWEGAELQDNQPQDKWAGGI